MKPSTESPLVDTTGQYCLGGTAAYEWPCMHPRPPLKWPAPVQTCSLAKHKLEVRGPAACCKWHSCSCSLTRAQQPGSGQLQALGLGSLAASTTSSITTC
jgi:hypothetical protein